MPKRRRFLELSVIAALLVLLTSRSVLLPSWASQLAPLLAVTCLIIGLLIHSRFLVLPRFIGAACILVVVYSASSIASGMTDYFLRALSIGILWVLSMVVGANLFAEEKRSIIKVLLLFALVQVAIAACETVLSMQGVRSALAADQAGQYIVRPNTILGDWTNRAQGTVGYPIPLAHFLVVGLGIALFSRLRISLFWRMAASLVLVMGIVLSGTRSGLAAAVAVVALGTLSSFSSPVKLWKIFTLAVVGLSGLACAWALSGDETLASDGSFTHRFGVINSVGEIFNLPILQIIFGSGFNSHEALFERGYFTTQGTFAVDNAFVTLLVYTGLLGLCLFLLLLFVSLRCGTPLESAVLGGFATFGMSYDFVNWHLMGFLFFLFIGFSQHFRTFGSIRSLPHITTSQSLGVK